jgi:hypothetical protein
LKHVIGRIRISQAWKCSEIVHHLKNEKKKKINCHPDPDVHSAPLSPADEEGPLNLLSSKETKRAA